MSRYAGQRLGGRFILDRELGSGGMSTVFLGTDEVLGRPVAVKVLKPEFLESDIGFRFRREGRTAARLSHPNIVQVYDAGEDELEGRKVSYIVMEHVPGGDLRGRISRTGPLSVAEVSGLSGVAAGLAHAHERGVVHRDVKPHNILLNQNGRPKLADFGIARALDATQATRTGTYMGTARYSSPEQLQGKEITPKSDVYSLGATLYEAVTGEAPFDGTPIEIASQHVSRPPVPPGERAMVDGELERLILDCLAKDPGERPTAEQVDRRMAALHPDVGTTGTGAYAPPPGAASALGTGSAPASRTRTRRLVPVVATLVAVLALLGGFGAFALLGEDERGETSATGPVTQPEDNLTPAGDGEEEAGPAPPTTAPGLQEPPEQQTVPQEQPPPEEPPLPGAPPGGDGGGSSETGDEEEAAQTIVSVYDLAAAGEYDRSYDLLSRNFKRSSAQTPDKWRNTFNTLEEISFLQGPSVQVQNGTARASGVTRAVHTGRIERNAATWTLVREDGEWKLDALTIVDQQEVAS